MTKAFFNNISFLNIENCSHTMQYSPWINNALNVNSNNFIFFHFSTPNVKLYYPEPFIASPTFMHDDIWFLHIVIYQYWLWFFFIFLIVFFFISFIVTVRWCNLRFKPSRETRGVSRSKCGDLITATVPVSWATSIIIHESTDAIELADGFGTSEIAIGIRAYQWGWEYYYPKDLDLNFYYKNSSQFLGNSLKYSYNNDFIGTNKKLKSNLLKKDATNTSKISFNYFNNSLLLEKNWIINLYSFFSNKLLNYSASPLLTSDKIENFKVNIYNNFSVINPNNFSLINVYKKYYFFNETKTKLINSNYTFNYLNYFSNFNYSLSYLNIKSLNQNNYLINTLNLINNSFFYFSYFFNSSLNNFFINNYNFEYFNKLNKESLESTNFLNLFLNKPKLFYINFLKLNSSNWYIGNLIANQDYKRWAMQDLFEDFFWDYSMFSNFFKTIQLFSLNSNIETTFQKFNYFKNISIEFKDLTVTELNSFSEFKINFFSNLNSFIFNSHLNFQNIIFINSYLQNSWFLNNQIFLNIFKFNFFNFLSKNYYYFSNITFFELLLKNNLISNSSILNSFNLLNYNFYLNYNFNKLDFLSYFRNLNITYQSFTKIFKSVIEEERNLVNFTNLSNNIQNNIFVSQTPLQLNKTFNKFNNTFYDINVFKFKKFYSFNINSYIQNFTKYFYSLFPFSISSESDIIRYTWFDWYSIRNTISTKSMDTSLYGLHGAKYYSFIFNNNNKLSNLNQIDNFFNKYKNARNLLIPITLYSPLLLNNFIFKTKYLNFKFLIINNNSLNLLDYFLILSKKNFTSHFFLNNFSSQFNLNFTFSSSYFTSTYTSLSLLNKTSQISFLFDILQKREYLFNIYKYNQLQNLNLFIISNKNPIIIDFNDYTTNFKKKSINNSTITIDTIKSQYVPLRKGISNMIRIQADKAIAMPIETRIQILAVSKDIIHSWSIPSAGIKIDCIPGYSSHRVLIFLISGIYWGQCMEICGRFHHWMPIVVYFMKRDLFCLWCIHFIFSNKQMNNLTQAYSLQTNNSQLLVNSSWNSWLYN